MQINPVSTSAADLFFWEARATIPSSAAGSNKGFDEFQLDSNKCLCLLAYVGSTNYDAYAGDVFAEVGDPLDSVAIGITPPFAPNNFDVRISVNTNWYLTGTTPVPQACLAASAYRTGQQFVIPTIFPPMTKFSFEFTNIVRTAQLNAAGAARSLEISFGFMGYYIINENMTAFLETFPQYACEAQGSVSQWLKKFTGIDTSAFA